MDIATTYDYIATDNAGGNLTLDSLLDGDVVYVVVAYEDRTFDATDAVPSISGYTTVKGAVGFGGGLYLFRKVISGNTPILYIPVTFTAGQAVDASIFAFNIRDGKSSGPEADSTIRANSLTTVHVADSVTSAYANSLLLVIYGGANAGSKYLTPSGYTEMVQVGRRDKVQDPAGAELTVCWKLLGAAGATGAINTTSISANSGALQAANGQAIAVAISPSQAPSRPTVVAPVAGEIITIGRTYTLQNTAATDPAIASSSLTYAWEYTLNDGIDWASIGTTAAGVLTKSWNTTGLGASVVVRVRVRANNGTDNGPWAESGTFELRANVAPQKPINLRPTGIVNKGFATDFEWDHVDPGDPQAVYEFQYSSNADMSSPTSTGSVSSAVELKNFAANTGLLATAGTRYYQVRTKGEVDSSFGPWADPVTAIISTPPAAPNITAPTAGVPPTTGKPTVTFTSGGHVQYRYRLVKSAIQVYDSGWIASPLTSFVLAVSLINLATYTLYLAVKDSTGLASTEDSKTFTVTYTGPATPTLDATALDSEGKIQLVITNSDSPTKQHILAYSTDDGPTSAIRITPDLQPDAVWFDTTAASGKEMNYFVRAYVSTGGFTDSSVETVTQTLTGVWIGKHTKTSTTSNADGSLLNFLLTSSLPTNKESYAPMRFKGRSKQVAAFGRGKLKTLECSCEELPADASDTKALRALLRTTATLVIRDNKGRAILGKVSRFAFQDYFEHNRFTFTATRESYSEEVTD